MEKNNLRFHEISWQKFHGIEIIIEIIKKQTNKQKMNALSFSKSTLQIEVNVFFVVNFYLGLFLFWGMVMYTNKVETKPEIKN